MIDLNNEEIINNETKGKQNSTKKFIATHDTKIYIFITGLITILALYYSAMLLYILKNCHTIDLYLFLLKAN